jgi:hypothetical protein
MAKPNKLEDAELRRILKECTRQIFEIGLDILALQNCLIAKGLISPADLEEAVAKAQLETKTALNSLGGAKFDKMN